MKIDYRTVIITAAILSTPGTHVYAAKAHFAEGEGDAIEIQIGSDSHKNVIFYFACSESIGKKNGNIIPVTFALFFNENGKISPDIKKLIKEQRNLPAGSETKILFCLNEKCNTLKWGADDYSGGYGASINIDTSKPIKSIKVIPSNIPGGIWTKTNITTAQLNKMCTATYSSLNINE
jgi:hypothetical protein